MYHSPAVDQATMVCGTWLLAVLPGCLYLVGPGLHSSCSAMAEARPRCVCPSQTTNRNTKPEPPCANTVGPLSPGLVAARGSPPSLAQPFVYKPPINLHIYNREWLLSATSYHDPSSIQYFCYEQGSEPREQQLHTLPL